jgi:predicted permease
VKREQFRSCKRSQSMAIWRQDLAYALRRLGQSPGFAAVAVISIGLGIAANSTIFSMVSAFVLRAAPVGDPATLVNLHTGQRGETDSSLSWPLYRDVREQVQSFSGVTAYFWLVPASMGGHGEPERVWGQAAASNYFDVAQLHMAVGRGFGRDEEDVRVIVLGYGLWQRRFGADPEIAGKSVALSGRPFTVVGVAPPGFRGLELPLDPQFWVPLGNLEDLMPKAGDRSTRVTSWIDVAARLRAGVTAKQAEAELNVLGQRVSRAYPDTDKDRRFRVEPAGSLPIRYKTQVHLFLAALTVVVLLVLGIACANVANLLLAQAAGRQREMAVRVALGATRGRLLRQMLTESLLLGLCGGLLGVALSLWTTQALSGFRLPVPIAISLRVGLDGRVLLYTLAVSVGAGVLFGLAPALAASRPILAAHADRGRLRSLLVFSQIAMSLVLLCATGLFLRSLQSAARMDVGFVSNGVVTMAVDPALNSYSPQRTLQLLGQIRDRVGQLPGVESAAWTDLLPLSMGGRRDGFRAEGKPVSGGDDSVAVDLYMVTPGYFQTMGMPRMAGRDFGNEGANTLKVAVVNEFFAQRLFGGENPIGQSVIGPSGVYQVIGVVKNSKSRTLGEEPRPVLYRLLAQELGAETPFLGYSLVVRSRNQTVGTSDAVRQAIHEADPALAIFNAGSMDEHLRDALFLPRLAATLFGVCGGVGLLLAAVGLYGVMSYSVTRRRREIGIRLALGAQIGEVQRLIVGQGMRLTLVAVTVGLAAALGVAKFSSPLLYGVRPHDLLTFTAVPGVLIAVALVACWIPSRRAAGVEPLSALRYE